MFLSVAKCKQVTHTYKQQQLQLKWQIHSNNIRGAKSNFWHLFCSKTFIFACFLSPCLVIACKWVGYTPTTPLHTKVPRRRVHAVAAYAARLGKISLHQLISFINIIHSLILAQLLCAEKSHANTTSVSHTHPNISCPFYSHTRIHRSIQF